MIHAVVITHGRLGEELLNSAEMVFGQIKGIDSVALLKEDNPGSFEEKICKVLKKKRNSFCFWRIFMEELPTMQQFPF